jgi:hypothetical protein
MTPIRANICRAAERWDQNQGFHSYLPFSSLVLGLPKPCDEVAGALNGDKLARLARGNAFNRNALALTQC